MSFTKTTPGTTERGSGRASCRDYHSITRAEEDESERNSLIPSKDALVNSKVIPKSERKHKISGKDALEKSKPVSKVERKEAYLAENAHDP